MEPYYYNQMNKQQKNTYQEMKRGLEGMEASFPVSRLSPQEMAAVFFQLRLDCPELFWAVSFRWRAYPDSSSVELIPEYLFDKNKIKEHQKAMKARLERLLRPIQLKKTDLEKEQAIHDFICENIVYDKLKKAYSHEIIGPMGQGVGVCEGIAKTVKLMCDALGIWCMIAISEANPEKKIKYRHAWNVVKLDGAYYHLDATFDNTLSRRACEVDSGRTGSGEINSGGAGSRETNSGRTGSGREKGKGCIRCDYLNLDDRWFFRDHEPAMYPIPPCVEERHSYYREKKLSFTKVEEVQKRAEQAMRKGKTLIFQWRGGYLTRQMLQELLTLLAEVGEKRGQSPRVGLNWPQAVLQVEFQDRKESPAIAWEHANEEESATINEEKDYMRA